MGTIYWGGGGVTPWFTAPDGTNPSDTPLKIYHIAQKCVTMLYGALWCRLHTSFEVPLG